MKSLSVLAFLLCFSVGYGLKCYRCVSTESWDDCESVQKEMTCVAGTDRCLKGYADVKADATSIKGYEKGCTTEALCNNTHNLDFCEGKGECKINCCSGDLCNVAATQMASTIILVACAFVALM